MLKIITSCVAALLLGVLLLSPVDASAQSRRDFKEMEDNIVKLQKQLRAVQRRVFKGGDEGQVPPADDASLRQILADMDARFGTLDRQVRNMTGKFEELEHRQNRMEEQLALFRKDMDLRFSDLGGAAPSDVSGEAPKVDDAPTGDVRDVEGADVTPLDEPKVVEGGDPSKGAPVVDEPKADPRRQYGEAFSFVRKGDFPAAEGALKAFLADHGDHELAGNAQYWLGETYYARKDYARAAAAFLTGFQTYAKSQKGPDSLLKLGLSLYGMGKKEEACSALAELPVVYPKASKAIINRTNRELERIGCN